MGEDSPATRDAAAELREEAFREQAFRRLPLGVMAAAAAAAVVAGQAWTKAAGPLPWLVSLGIVGLPHGAAVLAVSRTAWRGWSLLAVWMVYVATMAVVWGFFAVASFSAIAVFAALSYWHVGAAHLDTDGHKSDPRLRAVAALARGCVVLATPLIAWPEATADAAAGLAVGHVGHVGEPPSDMLRTWRSPSRSPWWPSCGHGCWHGPGDCGRCRAG